MLDFRQVRAQVQEMGQNAPYTPIFSSEIRNSFRDGGDNFC